MDNLKDTTRWGKGKFSKKKRISAEDKKAIFWYYQAGLKNYKESDGILDELSQRYNRSPRQIQRYIEQVAKEISIESSLNQTTLNKAYDEHFAEVRSFIEHWKGIVEKRSSSFHVVWPPHYGFEQDKLFIYVLDHCPSIKDQYQALLGIRNEYQTKSDELNRNSSEQWQRTFVEAERKLRDTLEMSLLSQEYIRYRCDLCP